MRVAPDPGESLVTVRVRSLRTQQRAKSQCIMHKTPSVGTRLVRAETSPTDCHDRLVGWLYQSNGALFCVRILLALSCLCGGVARRLHIDINGEFDPGSGRTLAACLTHASRAERPFGVLERRTGEKHVSNLPLALGEPSET